MSLPKKRNAAVAVTCADNHVMKFVFSHGESITIDTLTLTPEIRHQAMLHGLKQKLVDAAAIGRNPDTGRSATIADKYAAVLEIAERITGPNPTWNKVRGGESGSAGTNSLLLQALMRVTGRTREVLTAFLESKSKEERAALRKQSRVAAAILEIQAEKAAEKVDVDSLLGELMGDDDGLGDGSDDADDADDDMIDDDEAGLF